MAVNVTSKKRTELSRNLDDGSWPKAGEWRAAALGRKPERKRFATICCPNCQMVYSVGLNVHQIEPDGRVTPSFVCTAEGCGYHEYIRLIGWVPVP